MSCCTECGVRLSVRNRSGLCRRHVMASTGRRNRIHPQMVKCAGCGHSFDRGRHPSQRYCSWDCYDRHAERPAGPEAHGWKGDDAARATHWDRAQRLFPTKPCEECGNPKSVRHHIDGDPSNNVETNVRFLCRSHHARLHHQLGDLDTSGLRR